LYFTVIIWRMWRSSFWFTCEHYDESCWKNNIRKYKYYCIGNKSSGLKNVRATYRESDSEIVLLLLLIIDDHH
jgi:hypothetical protein